MLESWPHQNQRVFSLSWGLRFLAAILLATCFCSAAARAGDTFEASQPLEKSQPQKLLEPWEIPERPLHEKIDKAAQEDPAEAPQTTQSDLKKRSLIGAKAKLKKQEDLDLGQGPGTIKSSLGFVNQGSGILAVPPPSGSFSSQSFMEKYKRMEEDSKPEEQTQEDEPAKPYRRRLPD